MKRQRSTHRQLSPAALLREYERLNQAANAELDLDEAALVCVVNQYRQQQRLDEGLRAADRALLKYPFGVRLYLAKAKVLEELHLLDYALEVLELAETYGPGTPQIHLQRAKVLADRDQVERAFAELDLLNDSEDAVLVSMRALTEALIFRQLGRHSDCYYYLESALRAWPDNEEALEALWLATEVTGRHEATEQLCEDILSLTTYSSRAWFNLAQARYCQGRPHLALVAFEYAYIIDPRYELAYREAGSICMELGLYARAMEVYEVMMEYLSGDDEVLLALGRCYLHTGSMTQARLCINRVLSRHPKNDEALYYSGCCHAAQNDYLAAVRDLERAVELDPQQEQYAAALADALLETGQLQRAEEYLHQACAAAPEEFVHWYRLVRLLLSSGREVEAVRVLDEAAQHTYASELEYARVAATIGCGREADGLRMLSELLQDEEECGRYETLFEVWPALREHDLVGQVIRCFV